jgi:sodium/proline symporter
MILTATFSGYFLLVLLISWFAYRRTNTMSDYILGGRSLGRWTTALSAGASDMSGWLLLGLPGYAYVAGFEAVWIALGLLIGSYLNWLLVAPRLREQSEALNNALTLPEYFENRFNDSRHFLRLFSALFILLFFLFYTSSGLVAGGKLFQSVFDLPYHWAVIAGALAILSYTAFGGFLAVCWTDLFQGLLMSLALIAVAVLSVCDLGGIQETVAAIHGKNPGLVSMFRTLDNNPISFLTMVSLLGWGLGYFGQPHIIIRFMAIEKLSLLRDARRIAVTWTAVSMCSALIIGMIGIVYLEAPLIGSASETVFMELTKLIFHPLIAGICMAAILAAIMSTADSQLLVASSAFTEDFYKIILSRNPTDKELVYVGRSAVIVIAMIATLLALNPDRKVLDLVSYAWAGFGATFGPVMLFSLFSKNMSETSAIAGILTGGITVVIWKQLQGGIFDLYELVPGFILSCLVIHLSGMARKTKINKTG